MFFVFTVSKRGKKKKEAECFDSTSSQCFFDETTRSL